MASKKKHIGDDSASHKCPYCGSPTIYFYCSDCTSARFDEVHRMFGITNGWDKKKHDRVEVVSGWRGRKVVGGFAHQNGTSRGQN